MATYDERLAQQNNQVLVDDVPMVVPQTVSSTDLIKSAQKDPNHYKLYSENNDGTQQLQNQRIKTFNGQKFSTAVQGELGEES